MTWLSPYRWLLVLGLGAGVVSGYRYWAGQQQAIGEQRATQRYNQAIDKQKAEAAAQYAALLAEKEAARQELTKIIHSLEKDREKQQAQNIADLRTRIAGPRLQFTAQAPECRHSGGSAKAGEGRTTGDPAPAVIQLPEPLNRDLLEFAADAQSLAIDYRVLYEYVNSPRLVCTVQ